MPQDPPLGPAVFSPPTIAHVGSWNADVRLSESPLYLLLSERNNERSQTNSLP